MCDNNAQEMESYAEICGALCEKKGLSVIFKTYSSAESLLILPIMPGELRISTACDTAIRGRFEGGRFVALETLDIRDGAFAMRFTRQDMPHLFLLTVASQKRGTIAKLESMMMN